LLRRRAVRAQGRRAAVRGSVEVIRNAPLLSQSFCCAPQVAITRFVAANMAEIIRARLQSVPRALGDAASALGLTWSAAMRLIILPQALRSVIPSFINLGIGIFLDTTLVTIGLFDCLNAARISATDPKWLGFYNEAFAFAALVYFLFCIAGSRYSTWLETRL
jgi:general L-amino acid transport system permease protein